MKKSIFIIAAAMLLIGCGDGDSLPQGSLTIHAPSVTLLTEEDYSDVVNIIAMIPADTDSNDAVIFATTDWSDGDHFTLILLPTAFPSELLQAIDTSVYTLSDQTAKWYQFSTLPIYLCDAMESIVGSIGYYHTNNNTETGVEVTASLTLYYVDKKVKVTASEGNNTYDLNLKMGWNMVYVTTTEVYDVATGDEISQAVLYSTTKPTSIAMEWIATTNTIH